jgi:hypothetical protein
MLHSCFLVSAASDTPGGPARDFTDRSSEHERIVGRLTARIEHRGHRQDIQVEPWLLAGEMDRSLDQVARWS